MKLVKRKLRKIILKEVNQWSLNPLSKDKSFHADLINELVQVSLEYGIKNALIGRAYDEDDNLGTLVLLDEYSDSCNNAQGSFKKALEFLKDVYGDDKVKKIAGTSWSYSNNKKNNGPASSLESVVFPKSLTDEIVVMPADFIPRDFVELVLKDPEIGLENYLIHIKIQSTGIT